MRNPKPLPLRTKIILNSTSTCMARVTRLQPVLLRFHDLPRFPHVHLPNQADNRGLCLRFPISSRPCLLRSSAPDSSLETIRGLRAQEQGLLPLPLAQGHLLQSAAFGPGFPGGTSGQRVPAPTAPVSSANPLRPPISSVPSLDSRFQSVLQKPNDESVLKTSWISAPSATSPPNILPPSAPPNIELPEKDKIRFFGALALSPA